MTREEFTRILKDKPCSYITEGDKIIITSGPEIDLGDLEIIPPNVEFRNGGHVYLGRLKSIPSGTVFKNTGDLILYSLKDIPPGTEFRNGGEIFMNLLTSLPPNLKFYNKGAVGLNSITSIPPNVEFRNGFVFLPLMIKERWFDEWEGNIRGIDSRWILRKMVKDGLFEKK
jgi:hypothetical protein